MAEQWEQTFKTFGEKTYTITQLIQNVNEGDDLDAIFKVSQVDYCPVLRAEEC